MIAAIFRMIFGLLVAALAAGASQTLFAMTPAELMVAGPERWQIVLQWILDTAVVCAVFAAPFVLVFGTFAEATGIRSFAYYVVGGVFVALAALAALLAGEQINAPTLANSYAIAAFLTAGFVAGITYWIVAGRFAGGRRGRKSRRPDEKAAPADSDPVKPPPSASYRPNKPGEKTAGSKKPNAPSSGSVPSTGTATARLA